MPTSSHWPTLVHSHIHTSTNIHSEPVKVNFKHVSTSQIPPVSQPAALFVDQRTDNKSFYRLTPTPPLPSMPPFSDTLSSSRSSSLGKHSSHSHTDWLFLTQSQLLHILRISLAPSHLLSLPFPFSLSLSQSVFFTSLPSPLFSLLSLPPLFLSHPSLSRCGGSCCSCFHFPSRLVRGNQRFCCNSVYDWVSVRVCVCVHLWARLCALSGWGDCICVCMMV